MHLHQTISRYSLTISPPGTGAPEEESSPDIAVVRKVLKTVLESLDTCGVARASNLAKDSLLAIGLEPGGSEVETFGADGTADASLCGPRAVGI